MKTSADALLSGITSLPRVEMSKSILDDITATSISNNSKMILQGYCLELKADTYNT